MGTMRKKYKQMRCILKRNMPGNMLNNYTKRIAAGEEEEEDGWLLPCH
jgi:hypothetical protein